MSKLQKEVTRARLAANEIRRFYELATSVSQTKDAADLRKLQVKFGHIERLREQFEEAHISVLAEGEPSSLDDKLHEEISDMLYSIEVLCRDLFPTATKGQGNNDIHATQPSIPLPKIHLSNFAGDITHWTNYKSIFESLVHNNNKLTGVQKLHYLVSTLEKEPLALIRHLAITEENYSVACKLLADRYENKRLIGDRHLEAVLSLPNLGNSPSNNLRKFVNCLKENLEALRALKMDIDSWSFILLHIISKKLSSELRTRFELEHTADTPTFNQLMCFLETQLRALENAKVTTSKPATLTCHAISQAANRTFSTPTACSFCNEMDHNIHKCTQFDEISTLERKAFVEKKKLCYNCLRAHGAKCTSKYTCRICKQRHHTKLHIQSTTSSDKHDEPQREGAVASLGTTVHPPVLSIVHDSSTVLLPTALVYVSDKHGQFHQVRALLDSASHVTLLTENIAQKLNLKRSHSGAVDPVGESNAIHTKGSVQLTIKSCSPGDQSTVTTPAWVMTRITKNLPLCPLVPEVKQACSHLTLADPYFDIPAQIDLLIGADIYTEALQGIKIRLGEGMPAAFQTSFGWIIKGRAPATWNTNLSATSLVCTAELEKALLRFWEHEEAPRSIIEDPESIQCERHFVETHSRDKDGRFTVRLPFKLGHTQLGDTRAIALRRYHNLERKLLREPKLREMYVAFMDDYIEQGHMRLSEHVATDRYFLPHHGILKETSSTTKLRTVFDASTPSTTGVSLNHILMPGPKLQQNIEDIVLRFRLHKVVFTGDVRQMYRQVKMHEDDCKYQTILWRKSSEEPILQYELTTVTYGVSSSAYLAMRVIRELAILNEATYPEASRALQESLFVDDIVCGNSTIDSARSLQQDLVTVLGQGGFQLRKWSSSHPELLDHLPKEHLETPFRFQEAGDHVYKILGLEWSSQEDAFLYHVTNIGSATTKRGILSNIARLYDPCGYLTPVTFHMKALMQSLWLQKLDWDEPLPPECVESWQKFVSQFNSLSLLHIARRVLSDEPTVCELHGFSDASERGYAAAVYLRVVDASSDVKVNLIMAKSRVAPIKSKLTIPRLELCGALLLGRLLFHSRDILQAKIVIHETTAWCDSTIALAWINTPPHRLQTFEANRVSEIQGLIPAEFWRHVPSEMNPADCASRGLYPAEIVRHPLWWSPTWLVEKDNWPDSSPAISVENLPSLKNPAVVASLQNEDEVPVLTASDSLFKVMTTMAWCQRFIRNARNPKNKTTGSLSVQELDQALLSVIKVVQASSFTTEIASVAAHKQIKGSLNRLNLFLDSESLLRVGGRLRNSDLPYDAKHPLLLPKAHKLTRLIIEYYHRLYSHISPTTLTSILQRRFWIISARSIVRHIIFKCLRCFKLKARPSAPYMGDLPSTRARPSKVFQHCGADFAGPFTIKSSSLRGSKTQKAYLCIFVCFATKAVHLEVVSDLSTEAFMACLTRFVSRRSVPSGIYTDCGTNFVGARRHLDEVMKFLSKTEHQQELQAKALRQHITWHLNPPLGPHMGGLWETAVKSSKALLKRIIGDQVLTFEELQTVFTKIEAVLNSRPICPLSSDPERVDMLTPGHFLIGRPLVAVPEYDHSSTPTSRLKRWALVQQMTQHFWQRWQTDYLHTLQQRQKWTKHVRNLNVGDLVLVQDPNLPPLQWRTGRITKVFPGADGTVRVVELKTATSILVRPTVRVVPLPTEE